MLILSRKTNERIVISLKDDQEIELTVVRIQGDKVRLGIEAPIDVRVRRSELIERDRDEDE